MKFHLIIMCRLHFMLNSFKALYKNTKTKHTLNKGNDQLSRIL